MLCYYLFLSKLDGVYEMPPTVDLTASYPTFFFFLTYFYHLSCESLLLHIK